MVDNEVLLTDNHSRKRVCSSAVEQMAFNHLVVDSISTGHPIRPEQQLYLQNSQT